MRELEATLASLIPGVSVDSILASFQQRPLAVVAATPNPPPSGGSISQVRSDPVDQVDSPTLVGPDVETLPGEADGFDWAEHEHPLGGLADGMAALSINPAGAGYLGRLAFKYPKIIVEILYRCHSECCSPPSTSTQ